MKITGTLAKSISYSSNIRDVNSIKWIVVHATGNHSDTAINNVNFYAKHNDEERGAHYFVDQYGVMMSIPDCLTAYSVGGMGVGRLKFKCMNSNSISVEICSVDGKPTPEALNYAEELIKDLMLKYNIPSARVVRHYDVTGKICPYWDEWTGVNPRKWFQFKNRFIEFSKQNIE